MKGVVKYLQYLTQVLAGRASTPAAQPWSQASFVDWDEDEIPEDAPETAEEEIVEEAALLMQEAGRYAYMYMTWCSFRERTWLLAKIGDVPGLD